VTSVTPPTFEQHGIPLTSTGPRYLNLDEMPTTESDIKIKHQGVEHAMVILTVEGFVEQQARAQEHERLVELAANSPDATVEEAQDAELKAVEVIRDAVISFFPTLPVNQLPVPKLFTIFAWLNQMSQDMNDAGAEGATDAEGNA